MNDKVYLIYKIENFYDDEIGEDVEETRLWKIVDCESKAIKEVYELNKPYEFIDDDYKPYSYSEHKVESDSTTLKENILNDALRIQCLSDQKDKEIERLKEEIKGYEQERERVLNIIDERNHKAIEYIEENCIEYGEGKWAYRTINADNTLNILRGVDKE